MLYLSWKPGWTREVATSRLTPTSWTHCNTFWNTRKGTQGKAWTTGAFSLQWGRAVSCLLPQERAITGWPWRSDQQKTSLQLTHPGLSFVFLHYTLFGYHQQFSWRRAALLCSPWTALNHRIAELRWNFSQPDAEQRGSISRPGGVGVEGALKFCKDGKGSGPQISKKCHPESKGGLLVPLNKKNIHRINKILTYNCKFTGQKYVTMVVSLGCHFLHSCLLLSTVSW